MMEEDKEYYNPLLEEYVDCLHFVLELGLELGFENRNPIPSAAFDPLEEFQTMYRCVTIFELEPDEMNYIILLNEFLSLGESLGFTWQEIEQAYFAKNKINHVRQETGY
jgi:dimeric dUTPase (all-alpha-NTP-PPase superfamily)